ncbi:6-bladed beta-propeller [Belliella sp. R4-6]|uniref:6-bladed beta-propeller n=1 Tax=Belliella alkalica TaxID=1730871 RepID=A0ABS9VC78_9BACT|nr:6-bladed beta-propeller [Belliella alkalica]MCH7414026.1 6-bladed beta-propeller [Belliella alkalica]
MRFFYSIYLVFALLLLFFSCSSKDQSDQKIISINPTAASESTLLSVFVEEVKFIKLETKEESILAGTREIIIKDRFIYAVDKFQKAVLIFDMEGQFVTKLLKLGDGPDQYRNLGPVFISDDESTIEVIEMMGEKSRRLTYSMPDFTLLDASPFNTPWSNSWRRDGEIYYFSTQQIENNIDGEATNAAIIVRDENNQLSSIFPKTIETKSSGFSPFNESLTENKNGDLFISLVYDDTFYQLKNKEAIPVMSIDFGSFGIDHSISFESIERQMEYLAQQTEGKASFPVLNIEDPRLLVFSYYFKENGSNGLHQYLDFKERNKVIHTKSILNDLSPFPEKVFLSSYFFTIKHEVMHKGYLVDIVLPSYSLNGKKEIEVEGLGLIHAEDNPIVMLMKMRDL